MFLLIFPCSKQMNTMIIQHQYTRRFDQLLPGVLFSSFGMVEFIQVRTFPVSKLDDAEERMTNNIARELSSVTTSSSYCTLYARSDFEFIIINCVLVGCEA